MCPYHLGAKKKVESAYHAWVKAYGSVDWKTYLGKVIANPETGQWSKEIAEFLRGFLDD